MTLSAPPRHTGTVVWVDLSTSDLERSIHFYERMFGWHYEESPSDDTVYVVARVAAGEVGGMMAQDPAQAAAGMPSCWTPVVGTDRLDALLADTRALGGTVVQSPEAIPGGARIAVVADPAGAALALMEAPPADHGMVWDETGAACWIECQTHSPELSRPFYERLFGWAAAPSPSGYVEFDLRGERVGGLMAMPPGVPPGVPSHWMVYFAVGDADAAVKRAAELGGSVLVPVQTMAGFRFAVVADPTGAVFGLLEDTTDPGGHG